MGDLSQRQRAGFTKLTNEDESVSVGVETIGGKGRALVDANISSVNVPQGQYPFPSSHFTILTAPSSVGDTLRFQLDGTSNDI